MAAIVAVAVLISVVVTLVTTLTGFQEVPREQIFLMRSFGATKRQILTMVVLPASAPTLLAALKLNIGMTWVSYPGRTNGTAAVAEVDFAVP